MVYGFVRLRQYDVQMVFSFADFAVDGMYRVVEHGTWRISVNHKPVDHVLLTSSAFS